MGMYSSPHTDVVLGGTINPVTGDHKPCRMHSLFLPMQRCGIVHRTHVELKRSSYERAYHVPMPAGDACRSPAVKRQRGAPAPEAIRARGMDVNLGAWSFIGLAAGSIVTVAVGAPWTTHIARRHTPQAVWSTPLFRETNAVMTLGWALLFLAAATVVAWTPLWVQPIVGAALYGLGRASPRLASWYASWRARALGLDPPEESTRGV